MKDNEKITADVERWLDRVVIGLELCPFAKQPRRQNRIGIFISTADSIEALMMELVEQLRLLERLPDEERETTLVVVPNLMADFDDFLDCLYLAEDLIQQQGWDGIFQLASFHPHYQFDGTEPNDVENLTNRSPYPIFHILREDSLSVAIENYGDTGEIPKRNQKKLASLSTKQLAAHFRFS